MNHLPEDTLLTQHAPENNYPENQGIGSAFAEYYEQKSSMDTPTPLEQSDPVLAEHFRQIANREHPAVRSVECHNRAIRLTLHSGRVILKSLPKIGRNDACSCGSGKKFKKCCGK